MSCKYRINGDYSCDPIEKNIIQENFYWNSMDNTIENQNYTNPPMDNTFENQNYTNPPMDSMDNYHSPPMDSMNNYNSPPMDSINNYTSPSSLPMNEENFSVAMPGNKQNQQKSNVPTPFKFVFPLSHQINTKFEVKYNRSNPRVARLIELTKIPYPMNVSEITYHITTEDNDNKSLPSGGTVTLNIIRDKLKYPPQILWSSDYMNTSDAYSLSKEYGGQIFLPNKLSLSPKDSIVLSILSLKDNHIAGVKYISMQLE